MAAALDCVVVGHNGREELGWAQHQADAEAVASSSPPLRDLGRTRIEAQGELRTYLDAFSALRHGGSGPAPLPLYSVEELPSLTAIYLVSFLRRRGFGATFVNSFTFERDRLAALLAERPRAVAVTTTFYLSLRPACEVVRFVRERAATVPIIVGGPLLANLCQSVPAPQLGSYLDRIGADYYVWEAQGEKTLELLLRSLGSSRPGEVANVYRRQPWGWTLSGRCPEANDLDECAVDWRSFAPAELGPTVSMRTARGCAFRCAFCDYPSRAGTSSRASLDTVRDELLGLARRGVRRISFVDDTFNVPGRRFREICALMESLDLGIEWYCYFRCDHAAGDPVYDSMVRAGCRGVFLGLESGDDGLLAAMDKRATVERYRRGVERLRERGVFVHASFLVGFPGETRDSVSRTLDLVEAARPDTFTATPWYYLHSTPIHHRAAEWGLEGEGRSWRHATMTSQEAMNQTDCIFQQVTGSAWLPGPGLDFWGIPYLLGKGFSREDLLRMLHLARAATPLGAAGRPGGGIEALSDFARALKLTPPRYVRPQTECQTGSPR